MLFLRLAWRNIWRNKRRTFLTLGAISFSVAILVFFIGLQFSAYDTSINASMSIFQGHMQVQVKGYLDKPQMREAIPRGKDLLSSIQQEGYVEAAAPRAFGFAILSSKDRSYGAQVVGVDTSLETKLSTIPSLVKSGKYLSSSEAPEAILGVTLAKNLKIALGDEVTVLGQAYDGSVAATVLPVVGIFESGSVEIDRSMIQIPISVFDEVFSMEGRIHSVALRVKNLETISESEGKLEDLLAKSGSTKSLTALTWDELSPGLKQAIELDMAAGWLFYASLVLIVTFSILNTFLMSVLERTREFGVLMALGMESFDVSRLVIIEAFLLTIVGIVGGCLLGSLVIFYFGIYGFSVPGSDEIMKLWNIPGVIYPFVSWIGLLLPTIVTLVAAGLAVIIPAIRLRRLQPFEAMRAT